MNLPRYADKAAQLLRRAPERAHLPDQLDRQRGLHTIDRALAAGHRRRRATRWLAGTVALAAAIWFTISWRGFDAEGQNRSGPVRVFASALGKGAMLSDASGSRSLGARVPLGPGSKVLAHAQGGAAFELSTGTLLELGEVATLAVESTGATQRLRLAAGELEATVARLEPGERFIVDTPDASIEVRGTRFRLTIHEEPRDCTVPSRTQLDVSEGVVLVRARGQRTEVQAGARWPAKCTRAHQAAVRGAEHEVTPTPPTTQAPDAESKPARAVQPASMPDESTPAETQPSALALQNDLFARAARARRGGNEADAARLYQQFSREFPGSPLAQNARVELMRLLSRRDPSAAREQARQYLRAYPNGFARDEAQRIAGM